MIIVLIDLIPYDLTGAMAYRSFIPELEYYIGF